MTSNAAYVGSLLQILEESLCQGTKTKSIQNKKTLLGTHARQAKLLCSGRESPWLADTEKK